MRSPEGAEYRNAGVYREIVPLMKIVCTDSLADKDGKRRPSTHYDTSPELPLEMLVTVTPEDLGGDTKLTPKTRWHPAGRGP